MENETRTNDFTDNVAFFFSTENRSMMGGWTRAELAAEEEKVAQLEGPERQAAEKAIQERLERERRQFGAEYNVDKSE